MEHTIHPPDRQQLSEGIERLRQPVLPLASMVQFLFLTGPFDTVAEVIQEMPAPIETQYAVYENPRNLLQRYHKTIQLLETVKTGGEPGFTVITEQNEPVDTMTAVSALTRQHLLADELEEINSLLCSPCGCRLCCIGPSSSMQQDFFEIPLEDLETELFSVAALDTAASRSRTSMDETPLMLDGLPFSSRKEPALFHWQNGWSLILPRQTDCPNLEPEEGRCRVYMNRPDVCRRPQIFPYVTERLPVSKGKEHPRYRLRQSLLAVMDCPYVSALQEDIAAYGAACELEVVFKHNKA